MFGFSSSSANSVGGVDDRDVPNCPSQISCVKFLGLNHVSAGSWSGELALWNVSPSSASMQTRKGLAAPVMDIDWANNAVVTASADKCGHVWDPIQNCERQFGQHNAAIRKVCTLKDNPNVVATGSWDCFVKFWDLRKQGEALSVGVGERVYAMDCKGNALAVGLAEKSIVLFDTRKPTTPQNSLASPLRLQTRCVSLFNDNSGMCLGSIEGRISISYFQSDRSSFNFKAHREKVSGQVNEIAYSVNSLSFHPKYGTFVSCGSDGNINVWDSVAKQKVKTFKKVPQPIVASDFNSDGTLLAYCAGYDYAQGKSFKNTLADKLYVKTIVDSDVKPK